jgi:hypothetical protein
MAIGCISCGSNKQAEVGAEMNIHVTHGESFDIPDVWVFPKLAVCFDCGYTLFALPRAELRLLEEGLESRV